MFRTSRSRLCVCFSWLGEETPFKLLLSFSGSLVNWDRGFVDTAGLFLAELLSDLAVVVWPLVGLPPLAAVCSLANMGDTRGGDITRGDLPFWGGVTDLGFLWKWVCPIGAGGGDLIPREWKEGGTEASSRCFLEGDVEWRGRRVPFLALFS